jgi:hypothetical protein
MGLCHNRGGNLQWGGGGGDSALGGGNSAVGGWDSREGGKLDLQQEVGPLCENVLCLVGDRGTLSWGGWGTLPCGRVGFPHGEGAIPPWGRAVFQSEEGLD